MCATEQTDSANLAHHLVQDPWTQSCRANTVKHTIPMKITKGLPSYHGRDMAGNRGPTRDSPRIRGGNWSMQGFRRSGHVHDEGECQMSIAEFMSTQERFESAE
jgi:hypothetical protein